MEEMKPCPFCGKTGTASIETAQSCEECVNFENEELCPAYEPYGPNNDTCPYKAVVCVCSRGGCGASGGWKPSVEEAIIAWNMRATEAVKLDE